MRAARVELIADGRTLSITAPPDWAGSEYPMLLAHGGAILDLLHLESDQRMGLAPAGNAAPQDRGTE
jgi:hypothetical protein